MNSHQVSPNKQNKMPHILVILCGLLLIAVIATYLIPTGQFERKTDATGYEIVVAGTYQTTDNVEPLSLIQVLSSVFQGMVEVSDIIFYMLIVGGTFEMLRASQAIEAAVGRLAVRYTGKEQRLIPMLMILFAIGGSVIALAEEAIPYITLLLPVMILLGFDAITAAAVVLLGTGAGFTTAVMNPFTLGVAQKLAHIPLFSGAVYRIILGIVFTTVSTLFVMRYAKSIKKDPSKRVIPEHLDTETMNSKPVDMSPKHKLTLLVVGLSLIILLTGVIKWGWSLGEIAGLFLGMGIAIGIVTRMSPSTMAGHFVQGCNNIVIGALIVGFARSIVIVLRDGGIMDTILNSLVTVVSSLPSSLTAIGMFFVQSLLSFLVPSGSGQASLTMPIMVPLGDFVGVTRQTTVLAFQLGDGISNVLTPTSGYFMAGLALAGIPWVKWAKFVLPLILMQYTLGVIAVTVAQWIGYS